MCGRTPANRCRAHTTCKHTPADVRAGPPHVCTGNLHAVAFQVAPRPRPHVADTHARPIRSQMYSLLPNNLRLLQLACPMLAQDRRRLPYTIQLLPAANHGSPDATHLRAQAIHLEYNICIALLRDRQLRPPTGMHDVPLHTANAQQQQYAADHHSSCWHRQIVCCFMHTA